MSNLYGIVAGAVETLFITLYLYKIKWLVIENTADNEEGKMCSKRMGILAGVFVWVILSLLNLHIISNTATLLGFLKLSVMLSVLVAAAAIDFKEKIIPNVLIGTGLLARVVIYILEFFFYNEIFLPQLKSDLFGFLIGFGIFLLSALLTHGAIGFGDVKLFGLIGIMTGAICTYTTMILSLLVSAVASIIFLITKKKQRKDSIPFGPCILLGYLITLLLTNY